jgi:hypothetical protein
MNLICCRSRFSPDNWFSSGSHYDLEESTWFHRTGCSVASVLRNALAYSYSILKVSGFSLPAVPFPMNANSLEKSFQLVFRRRGVLRNKYLSFCGNSPWVSRFSGTGTQSAFEFSRRPPHRVLENGIHSGFPGTRTLIESEFLEKRTRVEFPSNDNRHGIWVSSTRSLRPIPRSPRTEVRPHSHKQNPHQISRWGNTHPIHMNRSLMGLHVSIPGNPCRNSGFGFWETELTEDSKFLWMELEAASPIPDLCSVGDVSFF